jgi:hypothetical protein
MNTTFTVDHTRDILTCDISDEAMENAGGMAASAQAGCSLYSSYDACGCGC